MADPKTKPTNQNPLDFLNAVEPEQRRKDGLVLLQMFEKATGEKGVMWGPGIVGFGKYRVESEKTNQEVYWPLSAFSPRKQSLTLYVISGNTENDILFKKLGKHTTSKACLYINKLADVDLEILSKIIRNAYQYEKAKRSD
jgi:hypothetical protein